MAPFGLSPVRRERPFRLAFRPMSRRPMAGATGFWHAVPITIHPMTSHEITLVKTSFAKVAPIADQAAALFYARLFELDPSLRAMFRGDMAAQGRKLMQMIGMAVNGLDRLETLAPAVRQLGMRHAGYSVRDEHYDTVGETLLWTLGKGLGPDFTSEMQAAWARTYWLLAETMKAGARDALAMQQRTAAVA